MDERTMRQLPGMNLWILYVLEVFQLVLQQDLHIRIYAKRGGIKRRFGTGGVVCKADMAYKADKLDLLRIRPHRDLRDTELTVFCARQACLRWVSFYHAFFILPKRDLAEIIEAERRFLQPQT